MKRQVTRVINEEASDAMMKHATHQVELCPSDHPAADYNSNFPVTVLQVLQYCKCCIIASVTVSQVLEYCKCCIIASVTVLQLLQYCKCYSIASVTVLQVLQYCKCYSIASVTVTDARASTLAPAVVVEGIGGAV